MPSVKREGTKRLLLQVDLAVHTAANAQRIAARMTWDQVIEMLLQTWTKTARPERAHGISPSSGRLKRRLSEGVLADMSRPSRLQYEDELAAHPERFES